MSSGSEHSPDRIAALVGSLEAGRSANIESIGPAVAKLSVEVFIKHVLPPLHKSFTPAKVAKILAGLKVKHRGQKSAAYSARAKRWTAFDEVEKATEYATYQALATISNQITAEVRTVFKGKSPKQLFEFVNEGNAVPVSVIRDSTSKPDGYFVLREEFRQTKGKPKDESKATSKTKKKTKDKAYWMDIGPTGEYKLDNTEKAVKDDLEKILWNVTHTMREDARRRFAFAFTIEDTNMHLWYASRADILMSDNFDFMEEPEILVRFFLAFLYATETDAGWDPTMECVWDGSTPQYIITVHDAEKKKHRYKTVETLSDIGAGSLRGRGTRVWKVVPYGTSATSKTGKAKATEFVLKDCWVDQGAAKEGDIVNDILADAKKKVLEWEEIVAQHGDDSEKLAAFPDEAKFTKADLEELQRSLLLPSIHGKVCLADGGGDETLDRANLWHGDDIPYHFLWHSASQRDAKSEAQRSTLQNQLKGEHRSVYLCVEGRQKPVMYNAKVHYRVIFEEVCRAIRDERFAHRAYMYLARACLVLKLVHKAGWVHRDISAGNIFISQQDIVKLGDFEYAKRMSSDSQKIQDICTGTLDFMAVEVQQTTYLFRSTSAEKTLSSDPEESLTQEDLFLLDDSLADGNSPEVELIPGLAAQPKVRWFYNPIHDMESILWLAKYFTLHKDITFVDKADNTLSIPDARVLFKGELVPIETAVARGDRIANQLGYSRTLFYSTIGRRNALMMDDNQWSTYLHPALVTAGIVETLNAVRDRVVTRYEEVEKDLSDAASMRILAGKGLYTTMATKLRDACYRIQHLSARVVMRDLAHQASLLHPPSATVDSEVAQVMQNMSLQDCGPPAKAINRPLSPATMLLGADSSSIPVGAGPSTSEHGMSLADQITPPILRPESSSPETTVRTAGRGTTTRPRLEARSRHRGAATTIAGPSIGNSPGANHDGDHAGPSDPRPSSGQTVKSTKTVRPAAAPKRAQPKRNPARSSSKVTQSGAEAPPSEKSVSQSSGGSDGHKCTKKGGSDKRGKRGGKRS